MTAKTAALLAVCILVPGCAVPDHASSLAAPPSPPSLQQDTCAIRSGDSATVRQLVEMLGDEYPSTVQFAFDNLLSCKATIRPELVALLDDRTPMKAGPVLVLNRMPHFELYAQYGPQQVLDALALILGDPGDEPVCSGLMNGSAEAERDKCVAAWRANGEAGSQGRRTTR